MERLLTRPRVFVTLGIVAAILVLPACYDPGSEARGFTPPLPGPHQRYIDQTQNHGGFGVNPVAPTDDPAH
jgi:hypothetical protein